MMVEPGRNSGPLVAKDVATQVVAVLQLSIRLRGIIRLWRLFDQPLLFYKSPLLCFRGIQARLKDNRFCYFSLAAVAPFAPGRATSHAIS